MVWHDTWHSFTICSLRLLTSERVSNVILSLPSSHSLSLLFGLHTSSLLLPPLTTVTTSISRYPLSLVCVMKMTDMESEQRYASSTSSSSYSSSCFSEEIEAAEILADLPLLAMRHTHAADKCSTKRVSRLFTRDSPISQLSRSPLPPRGQAVAGHLLDENISTTASIEPERIHQSGCLRNIKVEQDNDLPKPGRRGKSRRNLTEEEKEARRIRRVLANRESARQTIRRRQALSEELSKKASALVLENKNLKKEKELALKEYQSLETTNKLLKAQIAKSIKTKVEQTPVEQELPETEVTPASENSPWFLYNRFPVTQLFWPSILQSPNPVHLHHTPFSSIAIPSNVYVPCSSESESPHKQKNHINDNRTQNPLYMFPCPWLYPLPEFGNGQSPSSTGVKDNLENLPLGKQYCTTLPLNTDYQASVPIKQKTEVSGWTDAVSINDTGQATSSCFSLNRSEKKTRNHIIEKFHGTGFGCSGHASAVKQEPDLQLYSAPDTSVSSTASYITTTSLEKKQEQFICPGKILVDAAAASEARKRRRELTKLKGIQNRQSRMEC